ncbi:MAG TPA: hypothetical protein VK869_04140 [Rubrobacteraceae bacterium]|nr:hypothetical protein [Rubrobacteraceae bacterium]
MTKTAPASNLMLERTMAKVSTAPSYIANFDSATAILRGVANYLNGKDLPAMGTQPKPAVHALELAAPIINSIPDPLREQIYIWSGWGEAIPPRKLGSVSAERVARWMVSEYPEREYPAVVVGSASGALSHLCCALGVPFLPQTFLIPVARSGIHPDEPLEDMEWAKEHAPALLDANPELQLHHMNDANQDRLMIQRMTYFRVKRLVLGEAFERFIERNLPPGGTIFLSECTLTWPTVRLGERYVFQHGALGGATPAEFHEGSERVAEYLARYGSHRRRWPSPENDAERPEAEWGFEPALRDDVERFARERGYRVRRIRFEEPEHLSPLVADLYRRWYGERRMISNRLLVGSFVVHEPFWTLRTGSVPWWMTFNKEPSAGLLEEYLDSAETYDEIFMMLFAHGVESVGLVPIERWRGILRRARRRGEFVGVDEREYPRDFATFIRYHTELKRKIPARYPLPGPLALSRLDDFLQEAEGRYPVEWS